MQIKIFSIPIGGDESATEEMNHFLRANKIVDIRKELATVGGNSCWTFCITYILSNNPQAVKSGENKIDYKEVLSPNVFERFSALRKLRKQIAENDAVPAYAVFTDAELAEIAKLDNLTLSALQGIPGIGKKKVEKYGNILVNAELQSNNETSGAPDGADSES
jgi:superfamily II DNA helicase RecQ